MSTNNTKRRKAKKLREFQSESSVRDIKVIRDKDGKPVAFEHVLERPDCEMYNGYRSFGKVTIGGANVPHGGCGIMGVLLRVNQ
jgi:hypothetical protein